MGIFDNYVPIADALDWRQSALKPEVEHREGYGELCEMRMHAKACRRVMTSMPFALSPTSAEYEIDIELTDYLPYLDKNGRATGALYPRQSGPGSLWGVEDARVEINTLSERWGAFLTHRMQYEARREAVGTGAPGQLTRPREQAWAVADDRCEGSLIDEATYLQSWFLREHSQRDPVKTKSIENKIRAEYRTWKQSKHPC